MQCTVLVGGDMCPTSGDIDLFCRGDAAGVFHDLLEDFARADLTVVNLECPLTDRETPIAKIGPNLRAPTACMNAIRKSGIGLLDLANNHILDHGAQGLESTLRLAESAGIATVGAGRNRSEARRILIRKVGDVRIGIFGVAEHEFSIAGMDSPGANPLDLIDIVRNIAARREEWDFLIVLLHGGNEGYPYPSPRLMDTCRFLVEQGAGAVICHHSHCPGCWESYNGGHIVYGQGNLVFGNPNAGASWYEGFLVHLSISKNGNAEMSLVPYEQSRESAGVTKLQGTAAATLLESIAERSSQISNAGFVHHRWIRFCEENKRTYFSGLFHHGRVLNLLGRVPHLRNFLYPPAALRLTGALMRCEAHREVLEMVIFPPDRSPPPS